MTWRPRCVSARHELADWGMRPCPPVSDLEDSCLASSRHRGRQQAAGVRPGRRNLTSGTSVTTGDHARPDGAGDGPRELRIGVLADPGLPAEIATALADGELAEALAQALGRPDRWRIEVVPEVLPLDERARVHMAALEARGREGEGWDITFYLTDLPRRAGTQPVVAELSTRHAAALISLPALGWLRPRRHARDTMVYLVGRLTGEQGPLPRRRTEWSRVVRETCPKHPDVDVSLSLTGWRGHARLLFGMVRDNRPWRLVPHLASATAAAAAATAFGIFYSTIWSIAEALPAWRLALIMVTAMAMMAGWLLTYNHMWEPSAGHLTPAEALLYNASTAVTLLLGVACMYGILYVISLAAAMLVLDDGYLRSQLGHPIGFADYATLVWLASSIGVVAGALGSSLDSEEAVQKAAYSRREQQRRAHQRDSATAARLSGFTAGMGNEIAAISKAT
jgi:hypothetical protein